MQGMRKSRIAIVGAGPAGLAAVDLAKAGAGRAALQRYEDRRKPHTSRVLQEACLTGRLFHLMPMRRCCRRRWATQCPSTVSRNWQRSRTQIPIFPRIGGRK